MPYGHNLPPLPVAPLPIRPSLTPYVWRGDKFDEIGTGVTSEDGHLVHFSLGVQPGEVVELRAVEEQDYPGQQRPGQGAPKPTFLAFFDGTERRAGTVWPHEDGKGHRLKPRTTIPDGAVIALRTTGYFTKDCLRAPSRHRAARHRPHINA